ncbi:DUF1270 family protein, partial [Staphylococcus aureus]
IAGFASIATFIFYK